MPVIYISYGPSDDNTARLLAADLRTLGAQVSLEANHVRFAPTRPRILAEPVRRCTIMLVILSPDALNSDLVTAEWRYALDHDTPLIPLLHRPADIPDRLHAIPIIDFDIARYPQALEELHYTLSAYGIALESLSLLTAQYKAEWQATMQTARDARAKHTSRDNILAGIGGTLILVCFFLLAAYFVRLINSADQHHDRNLLMAVDFTLAQVWGWSSIVIEIILLIVGGMLVARRFGSPTFLHLNISRTAGAILLLLVSMVVLHAQETRTVDLTDIATATLSDNDLVREKSRTLALDDGGGGGWIGHQFYMLLRQPLGAFGTTILLLAAGGLGALLLGGVSPVRIVAYLTAHRRNMQERQARRAVRYRTQVEVIPPTLARHRPSPESTEATVPIQTINPDELDD